MDEVNTNPSCCNTLKRIVTYKEPHFSLSMNVIYMIWNARRHWSPESLSQRIMNRKIYFDTKYPDRPTIIIKGDKEWLR